jgi:tetrahydromethanopterin S-methyltransferase subunit F
MSGKRAVLVVIGFGLLASQAGHLLAYQVRFGTAAVQVQSTGTHSYFPTLARASLGLAAGVLLAALLLVALARVLTGREVPGHYRPSYMRLLAALFTIQLAAFSAQEVGEALVAGAPVASAPLLLLWGTLGQLPVAALAALALRWLGMRVEAAVGSIKKIVRSVRSRPLPVLLAVPFYATPDRAQLASRVAATSAARRGPPYSLLISAH